MKTKQAKMEAPPTDVVIMAHNGNHGSGPHLKILIKLPSVSFAQTPIVNFIEEAGSSSRQSSVL